MVRRFVIVSLLLAILIAFAMDVPSSLASDFPNKAIQLVCPYAAGGDSDLSARIVAEKLHELLGQPILVVNKPGAGSALGTNLVIGSKPDGYTLLTTSAPMVFAPIIYLQPPFKIDDLVPVGRLALYNNLVVVNKSVPATNMAEFIAHVKKNPRSLSYGSPAIGSTGHFVGELVNLETNIDLQHIPFAGVAPTVTALAGNHVQAAFISLSASLPHIKSGAIKPLAVLSNKPDPDLPQVPTTVAQGFASLIAPSYHIIYAPAKIPAPILKILESSLEKALEDEQVRKKIEGLNLGALFLNSQETKKFLDSEIKKWTPVARKANIVVK